MRANPTPQQLTVLRLPHPETTLLTTPRRMAVEDDLSAAIQHVLLNVVVGSPVWLGTHCTATMPTAVGCSNFDHSLPGGRLRAIPARMPDWSATSLAALLRGNRHRLLDDGRRVFGESTLALASQFPPGLLELLLQLRDLCDESPHGFSFCSQCALQHGDGLLIAVRNRHQHAQTGSAKMRAMSDTRTAVFRFGVEGESHRHSFRILGRTVAMTEPPPSDTFIPSTATQSSVPNCQTTPPVVWELIIYEGERPTKESAHLFLFTRP